MVECRKCDSQGFFCSDPLTCGRQPKARIIISNGGRSQDVLPIPISQCPNCKPQPAENRPYLTFI